MKNNWEILEEEWQKENAKLETEQELHRISFVITKKCKCRIECCHHYENEKNRIFGRRVNELLAKGMMISACSEESLRQASLER